MKTVTRQKTVDYEVFITSDGKEFNYKSDAELHEAKLKGTKKNCPNCNGKGRVNERTQTVYWNFGHNSEEREFSDKCDKCDGKGILELKWV
jgi:DnaJ-class molecular chaperone